MGDYNILSMDDHIFEPPDLWTNRIEARFKERAPYIARIDDGSDWWFCDGAKMAFLSGGTQPGLRFEDPRKLTVDDVFENARPGGYIPEERIKDMDLDGIGLSVLYPTCALVLYTVPDTSLLNSLFRTYNDWLAEYCSANPRRLKGIALLNLDDIDWGVGELERCLRLGLVGAAIPAYVPAKQYQSLDYEPLWSAAEDLGVPLSLHVASNRVRVPTEQLMGQLDSRDAHVFVNSDHWVRSSLAQMVLGGVFERHPELRVGSIEHSLSWVPYFLERLDYTYTQRAQLKHWHRYGEDMLPSDYFRRNTFLSFQEDALGVKLRDIIGVDNLQWGSDYPHQESTFPKSREILEEILADCTLVEKAKIAGGNGARVYHFN